MVGRKPRGSREFLGSRQYWESRYAMHGNSGAGSYDHLAEFKAEFLNDFVRGRQIRDVIEFGCGDGNQLTLAQYPQYLGLDVSPTAIAMCRKRFGGDSTKRFILLSEYAGQRAQLSLSLDVIYHLVEDAVFEEYMAKLFDAARDYVIIYSSNTTTMSGGQAPHVRHRVFTEWIDSHHTDWKLESRTANRYPFDPETRQGSFADFFVYRHARAGQNER
jgi:SAM-dependent methyltransferase